MRLLTWLLRLVLFVAMLGFALSNTDPVSLRFFGIPEFAWRAPLVLFLLIFFAAGALAGVLSSLPTVFRQRRQIGQLRKQAARAAADAQAAAAASAAATPTAAGAVATAAAVDSGSGQAIVVPTVRESGIRGI